jgi:hypothetical protein
MLSCLHPSVIISRIARTHLFHESKNEKGVDKVEVRAVMFLDVFLPFPNNNDHPPQILLKHVKSQLALWEGVTM